MNTHDVVVVGAGPTGLMLAAELALAGVDAVVVEKRPDAQLAGSRAGGLQARTLEVLEQRGVAGRFVAAGKPMQVASFARVTLDISDFPTRHPYGLALWQNHIERLLTEWATELGVRFLRQRETTGFNQDDTGVTVDLSDGSSLRTRFLVGCDGGRSLVRKKADMAFPGWDATTSYLMAEAETAEEPPWGIRRAPRGVYGLGKTEDGKRARVVLSERQVGHADAPTEAELRQTLVELYGSDFGIHSITWLSRFTDMARQAAAYRSGRVLLAGDAAHIHSPVGGQGLNLGVQDAVNLGWKLALVARGRAPDSLLDSYHAERHPVGARVLRNSLAQSDLDRNDPHADAVREAITELLNLPEGRKRYGAMMSGLDIHYDLGAGHPMLGRRVPDVDVETAQGTTCPSRLLHRARPLLLNLGTPGVLHAAAAPWEDRVLTVDARREGPWELPVLGVVPPPMAVLVRPDGHVAWVGDGTDTGLLEALGRWCGTPQA